MALWTESKYFDLADSEIDCKWQLFVLGEDPTIADWLPVRFSEMLKRMK